jgi:hypothetical protein
MSENEVAYAPSAARKWLRRLLMFVGVLVAVLVIAYLYVTSATFLKAVVLPRVGQAIGGEVTVAEATIQPFSQVVLRQLTVKTTGAEPLLQAEEVRARYNLFDLLGGAIKLDEIAVIAPTVVITQETNGTSNLDPLLKLFAEEQPKPVVEDKPLELALKKVVLQRGTLRHRGAQPDGSAQTTELKNLDVALDQLQNGKSGKLTLSLDARLEQKNGGQASSQSQPTAATSSTADANHLQAQIAGAFDFALDAKLLPQTIKGSTELDVAEAKGLFSELAALRGALECELTPSEIRQLGLRFERGGQALGQLRVSGPVELAKLEGRLKVEVLSLDRNVLNLFGVTHGLDFARTVLNSSNTVDVSRGGTLLSAKGRLTGSQFSVVQQGRATPPLDVEAEYQALADLTEQSAVVQKFTLTGKQATKELLSGALDRPMNLSWGREVRGFVESTFQLTVNQLSLADWQAFFPTNAPSGRLNATLKLVSQRDGKLMNADLNGSLLDLAARFGTNEISQATVELNLAGRLEDFEKVLVERAQFTFAQRGQTLVTGTGSANYDLAKGDFGSQTTLEAVLPAVLRQFPVAGLTASAGTVKFSGLFEQKSGRQTVIGNLLLADFTGAYGDYKFQNYQTAVDCDLELKGQELDLRRVSVAPKQGFEAGGSFDVSGRVQLDKDSGRPKSVQLSYKTVALNQNALRPFLTPLLAPRELSSVALNLTGSASFNEKGETSTQTEVDLRDLVVKDPENKLPATPLSVRFVVDAIQRQAVTDLRKLTLWLTPTERARNELQAAGRLDFSTNRPGPSALTIRADALDLTPYYDLFVTKPQANAASAKGQPAATPASSGLEKEPDPIALPFQQFVGDLTVGRLYVNELALSNVVAGAKINNGQLRLDPLKLLFNGVPVTASADLNLAVPGYRYQATFDTKNLPLAPLVDSFQPERKGQVQGTLTVSAQVDGAGITGASLQKNLAGRFDFASTNLNVSIDKLRNKALKAVVDLVAALPELRRNPAAGVVGLLAKWTGATKAPDNWVDELMKSPIDTVTARGVIGQGRVDLQHALVRSPAFLTEAQGTITLASVLTNSPIDIPLTISLRRSLAEKADLLPVNTAPDGAFVPLPKFAKLTGTVGAPETRTDKTVLAGMFLRTATGLIGGNTGNLLQGLGNVLTGQPAAGQQPKAPTNEAPQRVKPADLIPGVLDLLKPKKKEN